MSKRRVAIDFDGVIHAYKDGWTGVVPQEGPIDGSLDFLNWLRTKDVEIVILSSRARDLDGKNAIEAWLHNHNAPYDKVTDQKVGAVIYIDDRGFRFEGPKSFSQLRALLRFDTDPGTWQHPVGGWNAEDATKADYGGK